MGPRETADNTLGYSTGSRSQTGAGRASASEAAAANVHAAQDPPPAAAGLTVAGPVGSGWPPKTGFRRR